jgi:hypothetical protein
MLHDRHYTLEQANAAIPWVRERLDRLREARAELSDEEAREALSEAAPTNGGGTPGRVVSEGFLALRSALAELRAADVVLRDIDRGLLDFPSIRNGDEVYLCLVDGEDEIGYWHEPEAGFDGRTPLDG